MTRVKFLFQIKETKIKDANTTSMLKNVNANYTTHFLWKHALGNINYFRAKVLKVTVIGFQKHANNVETIPLPSTFSYCLFIKFVWLKGALYWERWLSTILLELKLFLKIKSHG